MDKFHRGFSSLTNSLLEMFFFWRLLATHESSLRQTYGPSMWTNPYAQRVATPVASQEFRIALQEIRIAFISQYQNWVRNDWSVFLIAFDSFLLNVALYVLTQKRSLSADKSVAHWSSWCRGGTTSPQLALLCASPADITPYTFLQWSPMVSNRPCEPCSWSMVKMGLFPKYRPCSSHCSQVGLTAVGLPWSPMSIRLDADNWG